MTLAQVITNCDNLVAAIDDDEDIVATDLKDPEGQTGLYDAVVGLAESITNLCARAGLCRPWMPVVKPGGAP